MKIEGWVVQFGPGGKHWLVVGCSGGATLYHHRGDADGERDKLDAQNTCIQHRVVPATLMIEEE